MCCISVSAVDNSMFLIGSSSLTSSYNNLAIPSSSASLNVSINYGKLSKHISFLDSLYYTNQSGSAPGRNAQFGKWCVMASKDPFHSQPSLQQKICRSLMIW